MVTEQIEEQLPTTEDVEQPKPEEVIEEPKAEEPTEEVNWQARYEEEQDRRSKVERELDQLRGVQIGQLRQTERDTLLQQIKERQDALAEAQMSGDAESLRQKFQEIDQKAQRQSQEALTEEQKASFQSRRQEVLTEFWATADELKVDPNKTEAFKNALLYWNEAQRTGNVALLERVRAEILIAEKNVGKERTKRAAREQAEAQEKEAKKAQTATDADLATGESAAGDALVSDKAYWAKYGRGEVHDHQRAQIAKKRLGL